jgi:UDP-N-acetylmuramate--alanine ligase
VSPVSSSLVKEECHSDDKAVVLSFPNFEQIENYLKSSLGPSDLLITMGAGEQYKIGEALLD